MATTSICTSLTDEAKRCRLQELRVLVDAETSTSTAIAATNISTSAPNTPSNNHKNVLHLCIQLAEAEVFTHYFSRVSPTSCLILPHGRSVLYTAFVHALTRPAPAAPTTQSVDLNPARIAIIKTILESGYVEKVTQWYNHSGWHYLLDEICGQHTPDINEATTAINTDTTNNRMRARELLSMCYQHGYINASKHTANVMYVSSKTAHMTHATSLDWLLDLGHRHNSSIHTLHWKDLCVYGVESGGISITINNLDHLWLLIKYGCVSAVDAFGHVAMTMLQMHRHWPLPPFMYSVLQRLDHMYARGYDIRCGLRYNDILRRDDISGAGNIALTRMALKYHGIAWTKELVQTVPWRHKGMVYVCPSLLDIAATAVAEYYPYTRGLEGKIPQELIDKLEHTLPHGPPPPPATSNHWMPKSISQRMCISEFTQSWLQYNALVYKCLCDTGIIDDVGTNYYDVGEGDSGSGGGSGEVGSDDAGE